MSDNKIIWIIKNSKTNVHRDYCCTRQAARDEKKLFPISMRKNLKIVKGVKVPGHDSFVIEVPIFK